MSETNTGAEALFVEQQRWFKRRELIKLQLEKEIFKIVRDIVNEKIALIEPLLNELEELDKQCFFKGGGDD